jgi:predicted enzyme related to lactoylglutathione lyase
VEEITETLTKAESLGGTILTDTDPGFQKSPNAIIGDPRGAVFGVVEIRKEQP